MKRFAAYDPPEYVKWSPDPALLEGFRSKIAADPERAEVIRRLSEAELLAMYAGLVRNRLHDVALKRWVKSGVISKAWLGTGEEAATIGPVHALRRSGADRDVVAPMIRNAGACHEMGMPIADMLRGYLGTSDAPTGGRDLHIGDLAAGLLSPISHVGDVVPVIAGIALSFKMRGEDRVALTWVGDGSTKTAAFHEGINFAGVQGVPAIFVIQNNQVALGTRLDQHAAGRFADWPAMYGVAGGTFDGNHVLDAYAAVRLAADRARAGEGVRCSSPRLPDGRPRHARRARGTRHVRPVALRVLGQARSRGVVRDVARVGRGGGGTAAADRGGGGRRHRRRGRGRTAQPRDRDAGSGVRGRGRLRNPAGEARCASRRFCLRKISPGSSGGPIPNRSPTWCP